MEGGSISIGRCQYDWGKRRRIIDSEIGSAMEAFHCSVIYTVNILPSAFAAQTNFLSVNDPALLS